MIYIFAHSFRCHEETDDGLSASDEPYIVVVSVDLRSPVPVAGFNVPLPASRAYRWGPFGDVDGQENVLLPFQSFWGLNGEERALPDPNDAIFLAALMESDNGDPEVLRGLVAVAANNALFASLADSRPDRVRVLIQAVNSALGLPTTALPDQDDRVGGAQEVWFGPEDIALAETGRAAVRSLRFVGDGGDYTVHFHAKNRGQAAWRFCFRCHSLFFDGYPDKGRCPAGGGHAAAGFVFFLPHDRAGEFGGQPDWRFCTRCHSMFWAGDPGNMGVCAAGGIHEAAGYVFYLPHDHGGPGQDEWRFCVKCRVMFWNGEANKGVCPADGAGHVAAGFNFKLDYSP